MVKRFFDLFILIIFSPIFVILILSIAILIFIFMGNPIFFTQERVGKNNKIFKIIKFRTMKVHNGQQDTVDVSRDIQRITKLGYYLRSYSLDEIPEVINILKNEMSFVGPRPLLKEYLKIYTKQQIRRHDVLPGITGLAQINGRNLISWEDKFKYDIDYILNRSFFLDLKILIITLFQIIKRNNNNRKEYTFSDKFKKE